MSLILPILVFYIIYLIVWIVVFILLPWRNQDDRYLDNNESNVVGRALRAREEFRQTLTARIFRDRNSAEIDCSLETRYCKRDSDCLILCKFYANSRLTCDTNRNVCNLTNVSNDGGNDGSGDDVVRCDNAAGEYALLVGYTTIGVAKWQCIQLYSNYSKREDFCENGEWSINANLREPSYRDCHCSSDDVLAVFKLPTVYDNALPHCIPRITWPLYQRAMEQK